MANATALRNKLSDAPKTTLARSRSNGSSASLYNSQRTAANKENEHEGAGELASATLVALTDKSGGLSLSNHNNSVSVMIKEAASQRPGGSNLNAKLTSAKENANLQDAEIFAPRQGGKETTQMTKALSATTATSLKALQIDEMGLYKPRSSNITASSNKFDFCQPALRSKENVQIAAGASNTTSFV